MTPRMLALALPALLLGCGASPPPAASPAPPDPASAVASTPPPPAAPADLPANADTAPPAARAATGAQPAAGPQAASATTDAPLATGITQAEVLDQVQKHADLFDRCVSLGAKGAKGFRAKVTLKATIGPSGAVNAADVAKASTAKNPAVDACVLDAFKKLTFPRAKGSGATMLMCPLSFDAAQVAQ